MLDLSFLIQITVSKKFKCYTVFDELNKNYEVVDFLNPHSSILQLLFLSVFFSSKSLLFHNSFGIRAYSFNCSRN